MKRKQAALRPICFSVGGHKGQGQAEMFDKMRRSALAAFCCRLMLRRNWSRKHCLSLWDESSAGSNESLSPQANRSKGRQVLPMKIPDHNFDRTYLTLSHLSFILCYSIPYLA